MLRRLTHFLSAILFFACSLGNAWSNDNASSMILMAADHLGLLFGSIQASTDAVAEEYGRMHRKTQQPSEAAIAAWTDGAMHKDHTRLFNTWGQGAKIPAYQNPTPAFLAYGDATLSERHYRQLAIFEQITPVLRAAYNSFDFSWTYLTSADGMMLLYPFLTIDEAVNNDPPTEQVFYTQANFKQHKAGWTSPYLDLAGAGMMVTVSSPAYDGDKPIGVASHDITLDQISGQVLSRLAVDAGRIAYIVDDTGLVIGVSDPVLRAELQGINQTAGDAVLRYRRNSPDEPLTNSTKAPWINALTERLLTSNQSVEAGQILNAQIEGYSAIAARTAHTDWLVVLAAPEE